jgi:NADH:ubiquinone reductase (H+-translocating)
MKKIVIIGGGFAGLSAARRLSAARGDCEVTLVDKRSESQFLPMLPDIIGRDIPGRALSYSLEDAARRWDFRFLKDEVRSADLEKKEVRLSGPSLAFDYLVITGGTKTNFYGQAAVEKQAFTFDSVEDALRIKTELEKDSCDSFMVAGGGYTGIEIATSLWRFFNKRGKKKKIIIVEKADDILAVLHEKFRVYVGKNLEKMGIEVLVRDGVKVIEPGLVKLASGKTFQRAMLIWTAGVKTEDFVWKLPNKKTNQGRLEVDPFLRIADNVFVAGDAAAFMSEGKPLRMGIQFSLMEGSCAAGNILRHIQGKELKPYKPADLGYIVPMANNKSCGIALGLKIYGLPGILLHYFMCLFRTWTWENRIKIIKSLLKS